MNHRRTAVLFGFAILAALGSVACQRGPRFHGELVEPAVAAAEIGGVNWDGKPFHLGDRRGRVTLVFFGYTYCPDVCPFTLAKMKQLYGRLGARAADVKVVFVSVDPQRDSVEKLAHYVPSFDPRFYGVRLEPRELDAVARAYDVTVQYGDTKDAAGKPLPYYVDHTASFFVIDRLGRLRLKLPPNVQLDPLVADVETLLST